MKSFLALGLILIGVLAMISGESDDSPGLQGLGLTLILWVLYRIYRSRRSR